MVGVRWGGPDQNGADEPRSDREGCDKGSGGTRQPVSHLQSGGPCGEHLGWAWRARGSGRRGGQRGGHQSPPSFAPPRPGWTPMPSVPLQRHPNALSFRCSLADFQIEKKIGRGQFSEVYKATCLLDRKTVALKKVQVSQRPPGSKLPCRSHFGV